MLKVVIADDEARILSLIRLLPDWDALGIEVAGTAGNGLEALALIERERPDILITDIRMPGCQGLELIERARRIVPDIEIIIISGYAHFEYAQTAIKLGVGDYLLKPIKKDELTATLSKLAQRCYAKHPSDPGTAHDGEGRARAALREKPGLTRPRAPAFRQGPPWPVPRLPVPRRGRWDAWHGSAGPAWRGWRSDRPF